MQDLFQMIWRLSSSPAHNYSLPPSPTCKQSVVIRRSTHGSTTGSGYSLMQSFPGQSSATVFTGWSRLLINTISQWLISLNDFGPSLTEYVLSLSAISDRKKGNQNGYQKKIILTLISINPSSVEGQPKVYDRGQISWSASWSGASRRRIQCFAPARNDLPGCQN